jgi:3',5'-cyclic-nucleotide phosphodiesterase
MMKKIYIFFLLFTLLYQYVGAQNQSNGFNIIPLGVKGGLDEANLSAYLVAAKGSSNYICLDAGTLNAGLQKIAYRPPFDQLSAEEIQQKQIKAYCISHGHLDHLAGLIMNAPNDAEKPIYAFPSVIEVLKHHYFTWKSWANFANEGEQPILNKYTYQPLTPKKEIEVPGTGLFLTAFSLSHVAPYESTAFLVRNHQDYLLYLGDTGADTVEKTNQLAQLWERVAPLVESKQLTSIFIEVSFDNSVPNKALFGHLTPMLLMEELNKLNRLSNGQLKSTCIYITHMKPCNNCVQNIQQQIASANNLGLTILYPEQGKTMVID